MSTDPDGGSWSMKGTHPVLQMREHLRTAHPVTETPLAEADWLDWIDVATLPEMQTIHDVLHAVEQKKA